MCLSPLSSLGFDQKEKNITYKVLVVALNKNSNFYHFFPTFSLNADFFQVWKISRQISRLFQEFKTLYEPWEQPWSLETIRGFTITLGSSRNFQLGENFLSYCWYDVLWFWNERRIGESRNSADKTKRTHALHASLCYSNSFRGYVLLIPIT